MTLAEAFAAIAQAGGRFVAEGGSILVDLPPGGPPVPGSVLAVLTAHREILAAALGGAPPGVARDDERAAIVWAERQPNPEADKALATAMMAWGGHQTSRGVTAPITPGGAPTVLRGMPFATTIDTLWYAGRRETLTIPAGSVGLTLPSVDVIVDDFSRRGLLATLHHMTHRGVRHPTPVWLEGQPRVLERALMRFDGVTTPPCMHRAPWTLPSA